MAKRIPIPPNPVTGLSHWLKNNPATGKPYDFSNDQNPKTPKQYIAAAPKKKLKKKGAAGYNKGNKPG